MADAGFRLAVEGDIEFKRALEQIDARIKANKAELKALTLEYNNNGGSVETLKQKTSALLTAIDDQTKKVNSLEGRYRELSAAAGENAKETQQARAKYLAAQAALLQLNQQLSDNEKLIREAQDTTAGYENILASLEARLAENASKLELVTATTDGTGNAAAQARERIGILTDSIAAQSEKLTVMRARLDEVEKEYGANSVQAAEYRTAINKAQVELDKMNKELGEAKDAAKKAEGGFSALSGTLTDVAEKFGVKLPDAIKGATDKLDGFTVVGSLALTGLIALGKKLVELSIEASNTADDILTLAVTTGISTDAVQEFRYAVELVDVSYETMQGSLSRMIRTMNNAKNGSQEAANAFKTLHVRVTDNNRQLRDANEVFYQVIDRLGQMRNETERDAIAMQIFGRSARELNPLIEAGSERLRELADEAHRVGYVMDEDTLNKYGELNDAMMRMNNAADAAKLSLGMIFLPILTDLFNMLSKINPQTVQAVVGITAVVAGIVAMVSAIKKVVDTTTAIAGFFEKISIPATKTKLIIMAVVAALIALGAIIAVIIGRSGDLERAMGSIGNSVAQMQNTVNSVQNQPIPRYARGTSNHPGGLAIVGEEGPELVALPAGSRVYTNRRSRAMMGGTTIYNITIDAKNVREFDDMVRIAERQRLSTRMGYVGRRGV